MGVALLFTPAHRTETDPTIAVGCAHETDEYALGSSTQLVASAM